MNGVTPMKRWVTLVAMMLLTAVLAVGCSSVDYLKDVSRSFERLQDWNDDLAQARSKGDDAAFLETLDDMKRETKKIEALQPGSLTKKAGKEVKEKNDAISAIVDDLLQEAKSASPDERKLDDGLKRLNAELWDTVS